MRTILGNIVSLLCFVIPFSLQGKENSATLSSPHGDKVMIRYDLKPNIDGSVILSVMNVQKRLGVENGEKYRKLDRVRVLFFDRRGGYSEDQFKSDLTTDALTIPSNEISYSRSKNGVVWLDEHPELNLKLLTQSSTLSIPVYLAYYEKKHQYRIFASCGNLTIPLSMLSSEQYEGNSAMVKKKRTMTTTEEIEEETELSDTQYAELLMERIESMLAQSSDTNMPDGIDTYVGQLRELEMKITDRNLKAKIADLFMKVEERKSDVASSVSRLRMQEEADASARTEETEVRRNLDYLNERLDKIADLSDSDVSELKSVANDLRRKSHSITDEALVSEMRSAADRCDKEVKKIDDSKKRRNIWMIIGGIIMAILMFVGNHFLQQFRNLRSQKGMEEMQAKIMKQAENDAKRRARSLAHNHIAKARNAARGKVIRTVEGGINNVTKGKGKKVTI